MLILFFHSRRFLCCLDIYEKKGYLPSSRYPFRIKKLLRPKQPIYYDGRPEEAKLLQMPDKQSSEERVLRVH